MKSKLNFLLFEFSLSSIFRHGAKNIFIFFVFTLLTFLLSSVLFVSNSIKSELDATLDSLPDITVQKLQAGRQTNIPVSRVDELLAIQGVSKAVPRIWGYYYFAKAGVNFSVLGIDSFDDQYKSLYRKLADQYDFSNFADKSLMLVGKGVDGILRENYYKGYFNFIKPDGTFVKMNIGGIFTGDTRMESNDLILMPKSKALEIFGMHDDEATDIVIRVANPVEIPNIATKISLKYPDCRVITKEDLVISYQNIFDYKGGLFLALFVISGFTFFMIIYDKASGLSSEEKREIGILKALGWKVDDILKEKFYEAFAISFLSFITAICMSMFFVYFLNAPFLRNIFIGYSTLKPDFILPFSLNFQTLSVIFFVTVPIYIAATIVPSWRVASMDADEVMR
ncbi:ABC transporter permease [Sulfurospirillum sp. 1612]|uniref:ABC transporter permease n=1 Tax=Sulfurospirillum sp. 1612 TaxID=3094835 RepID=UPI002F942BBC